MNGLSEAVTRDQVLMKEIKRADWFLLLLFLFVSLAPWYLLEASIGISLPNQIPIDLKGSPSPPGQHNSCVSLCTSLFFQR